VNEVERERWLEELSARRAPTFTTTDASGRTTTRTLPVPEPETWPETKPPFVAPAAWIAPGGRLWVERALAVTAAETLYDVFDRRGRLVERISLPAATSVVGFGRGTLYTVRLDEDDLLHLQRHAIDR
jgi:hypothetical protein